MKKFVGKTKQKISRQNLNYRQIFLSVNLSILT